jgi:hypothetical protein
MLKKVTTKDAYRCSFRLLNFYDDYQTDIFNVIYILY